MTKPLKRPEYNPDWPALYRYFDCQGDGTIDLYLERFLVLKETEKCWRVVHESVGRHWAQKHDIRTVLKDPNGRRYCYEKLEHALYSYKARKQMQAWHAKISAKKAALGLEAVKRLQDSGNLNLSRRLVVEDPESSLLVFNV